MSNCKQCKSKTKTEIQCKRKSSCIKRCNLMCWQHSRIQGILNKEKGSLCKMNLLKKVETYRRPFIGLGISGMVTGISGSISVDATFKIFQEMYKTNRTFVDAGAADGYVPILATLYGYSKAIGIEYNSENPLRDIFNSVWKKVRDNNHSILELHKPTMIYSKNVGHVKINELSSKKIHVYSFWDGFNQTDSDNFINVLNTNNQIEKICLIRRRSREYGTVEKLKDVITRNIKSIKSIDVRYQKANYLAIILEFR